jgi:hypothetical protein
MAGPPFTFANHFQVVGHFIGADITEKWRTELTVVGTTQPAPTDPIILAIRDYYRHNLRDDCQLAEIELRAWTFGPQPLAGRGSLWVLPLNLSGEKTVTYGGMQASPQLTGKEVVAFVKINTTGGKPGKQFIRQLYDLGDIGAVAGAPWETLPTARVTPATYLVEANATLSPYFGGSTNPGLCVVHFSKKNYNANPVTANLPFSTGTSSMTLVGPTTNKPTRKNKK